MHLCGFSPMCFFMWSLRLETVLAEKLHWLHLCGFFPLWMRQCLFKLPTLLNDLLHWEQLYLLPLWNCLWFQRHFLYANVLGHWSQDIRSAILTFHLLPFLFFPDDCGSWNEFEHNFQHLVTFPFTVKGCLCFKPDFLQDFKILQRAFWNKFHPQEKCTFRKKFYTKIK